VAIGYLVMAVWLGLVLGRRPMAAAPTDESDSDRSGPDAHPDLARADLA
jgi:hypothetical protein